MSWLETCLKESYYAQRVMIYFNKSFTGSQRSLNDVLTSVTKSLPSSPLIV